MYESRVTNFVQALMLAGCLGASLRHASTSVAPLIAFILRHCLSLIMPCVHNLPLIRNADVNVLSDCAHRMEQEVTTVMSQSKLTPRLLYVNIVP